MNYIVMDLEWNQSSDPEKALPQMPFEIVEIGAVKLDNNFQMIDRFERLIKPTAYETMNRITEKLIHIEMDDLKKEEEFSTVVEKFIDWCGTDYIFCSWGNLDLLELQRNMNFHGNEPLTDRPLPFLDVQKLFSLAYDDGKSRKALETAIDFKQIEKSEPFHRAYSDAFYTGKLLQVIAKDAPECLTKVSYDLYHPPLNRETEVKVIFDTYAKYISRVFASKAEAFQDKEVSSTKCYICHRNIRKKIKWFSHNNRHYYSLAYCETHGYVKGKIRVKKTEDGKVYVIKTTKIIPESEANKLKQKAGQIKEMQKKQWRMGLINKPDFL